MLSVLMVDADAALGGDGLAWSSAYRDLQDALTQAKLLNGDGDTANDIDQIWIAEGTYLPSAELEAGDARSASFSLVNGVTLYGGFDGTETTLDARDWSAHVTTLSGDLGTQWDSTDNAYTVVYCGANVEGAVDGISIVGGNADGASVGDYPKRADGGGIYNDNVLTVNNCSLLGNSANHGGGIYNLGVLTVTNSTFSNNSASLGGGIYTRDGTVTVTDSTFSYNSAASGGGIDKAFGTLTIAASTFSGNSVTYNGGGISCGPGTVTVTNSTLTGNSAGLYGGGIYNDCTLTVTNSTLSDNSANSGGGIYNFTYSGAVTAIVVDSTLSGNSASDSGGGILNYAGQGDAILTLTNSILSDNSAVIYGGGIFNTGYRGVARLTLTHSTLSGNSASDSGGGIFNEGNEYAAALTITDSTLSGNSAIQFGGGICNYGYNHTATTTLTNSTLSGNSAAYGGGVCNGGYNNDTTLRVTNTTIANNSASGSGGGVYNSGYYHKTTVTFVNSTLSNNSTGNFGGGIVGYGSYSTVRLFNTIVAENVARADRDVYYVSGTLSGSYNLIGDGSGQSSLINGVDGNQVGTYFSCINPKLSVLTQFDNGLWGYRLLPGSPATNAGSNALALDASGHPLTTDIEGKARIIRDTVDIGAYESDILPGDANADGVVNELDSAILASHWRQAGGLADGDFNSDGLVNDKDASIMAAHWGQIIESQATIANVDTLAETPAVVLDSSFVGPRQASVLPSERRRIEPIRDLTAVTTERAAPVMAESTVCELEALAKPRAHETDALAEIMTRSHDVALTDGLSDAEWLEYRLTWSAEQIQPRGRRLLTPPTASPLVLQ